MFAIKVHVRMVCSKRRNPVHQNETKQISGETVSKKFKTGQSLKLMSGNELVVMTRVNVGQCHVFKNATRFVQY